MKTHLNQSIGTSQLVQNQTRGRGKGMLMYLMALISLVKEASFRMWLLAKSWGSLMTTLVRDHLVKKIKYLKVKSNFHLLAQVICLVPRTLQRFSEVIRKTLWCWKDFWIRLDSLRIKNRRQSPTSMAKLCPYDSKLASRSSLDQPWTISLVPRQQKLQQVLLLKAPGIILAELSSHLCHKHLQARPLI